MKRLVYIVVFSACSLAVSAQNKKSNTANAAPVKPAATEVASEKELTNFLLTKYSASEKVEFDDVISAGKNAAAVTSLNLRKQGLTEIPDLSKFTNLIELDFSSNNLKSIPAWLNQFKKLHHNNLQ